MIDNEKFIAWVQSRFGDASIKGKEVKINSIYDPEDFKRHLWCNTSGGKKGEEERPDGVFHCWKTGRKGTIISLVMEVDHCSYDDAKRMMEGGTTLGELEDKLEDLFNNRPNLEMQPVALKPVEALPSSGIALPSGTFRITDLPETNFFRMEAENLLAGRHLPIGNKMVCTEGNYRIGDKIVYEKGEYRNRLIIPYYDRNGKLIYFNARYLGSKKGVTRYMGPPKDAGVGKEDVIYMTKWPEDGEMVFVEEGELDADSLALCGFNSAACGSTNFSDTHASYLRPYVPVLCVDNDKAGKRALMEIGNTLISKGVPTVKYIRPPDPFKDWNEMLMKVGPKVVRAYILRNINDFDPWTGDYLAWGL